MHGSMRRLVGVLVTLGTLGGGVARAAGDGGAPADPVLTVGRQLSADFWASP